MFVKPVVYKTADYQEIIRLEGANGYRWSYYPPSDAWDIGFANSAGANTNLAIGVSTLSINQWHHIAATVDGFVAKAYVDGMEVSSTGFIGSRTTSCATNKLWLAAYGTTSVVGRYYRGMIDQVRIYDYARSQEEIAWEYNKGGPVAWYKMDECEGTTMYDSVPTIGDTTPSNFGNLTIGATGVSTPGTCTSTGAWANGASGKRNASISFDGSDDYLTIPDYPNIDFGASRNLSVAFWTKYPPGNPVNGVMVTKWDGFTGYPYFFGISSAGNGVSFSRYDNFYGMVPKLEYTQDITNQWHHIVGVKDGGTLNLYVDGIRVATGTDTTTTNTSNSNPLYLGSLGNTNPRFRGQIDDLRIYNYALTPQQVKYVMNDGTAKFQ
jgi:hypothetical protein